MFKNLIPSRKHPEKESTLADASTANSSLAQYIDSIFNRLPGGGLSAGWGCDLEDSDQEIVVRAEAPGFEPDEIEIKMSGNQLVMEAEHREDEGGKGKSLRYGKFYRSITMPSGIERLGTTNASKTAPGHELGQNVADWFRTFRHRASCGADGAGDRDRWVDQSAKPRMVARLAYRSRSVSMRVSPGLHRPVRSAV